MSHDLAPGVTVAQRYTLRHRIGEGGMGEVWAADSTADGKRVALKFMKEDAVTPALRRRFLREARAANAIRHTAIVEIQDIIELEDGAPVLVMECLQGESLADKLAREGKLPLRELAAIMQPVVSAVGLAHSLGIVHRDLKPENIFLAKREHGRIDVKVLDFGIAKLTALEGEAAQSASLTGTGTLLGTPYYMSPEQIFGEKDIDHRADIWALGIIMYEGLTGLLPTEGENVGQVLKVVVASRIPPIEQLEPDLPEDICALVAHMMARRRDDRPVDLREVRKTLKRHTAVTSESFGEPSALMMPHSARGTVPARVHGDDDTLVDPLSDTAPMSALNVTFRRRRRTRRIKLAAAAGVVVLVAGRLWLASSALVRSAVPGATASAATVASGAPGDPTASGPGASTALAATASPEATGAAPSGRPVEPEPSASAGVGPRPGAGTARKTGPGATATAAAGPDPVPPPTATGANGPKVQDW
jgi:eukaryotic-like serine/threonine-protein kinase